MKAFLHDLESSGRYSLTVISAAGYQLILKIKNNDDNTLSLVIFTNDELIFTNHENKDKSFVYDNEQDVEDFSYWMCDLRDKML